MNWSTVRRSPTCCLPLLGLIRHWERCRCLHKHLSILLTTWHLETGQNIPFPSRTTLPSTEVKSAVTYKKPHAEAAANRQNGFSTGLGKSYEALRSSFINPEMRTDRKRHALNVCHFKSGLGDYLSNMIWEEFTITQLHVYKCCYKPLLHINNILLKC